MSEKKVGNKAMVEALSKVELELGRIKDLSGIDVSDISDLGNLALDEGINQSCNGICGDVEKFLRTSENDMLRAAKVAAQYNIEQLNAVSNFDIVQGLADHPVNQGCNGIC